jgi:dihydroflavonol-4-reductase
MKVLLTGANGFVGSHVLDRLLAQNLPVVVILRPGSDRKFIAEQLARFDPDSAGRARKAGEDAGAPVRSGADVPPVSSSSSETNGRDARATTVEVRLGGIDQPAALDAALDGVTHVIHCAGATKALNADGFFAVNQFGTRHLVAAVNRRGAQIQRFVHVSSLAAAGPATSDKPKREADAPAPVSDYGRSKLAAEREVIAGCQVDWTIIRPPAVYGPRDLEFLRLFKAVKSHVLPRFGGGRQQLSLVYVEDLAAAIVAALRHSDAAREIYFAGSPEVVTAAELAQCIAEAAGGWTMPLPLPTGVLWLACQWAEAVARLTRKPSVLNAQKWAELKAPGWVCDVTRLRSEVGYECRTTLREGAAKTRDWYRAHGWL